MKGLFIPEITAKMFRNGCLESIEALMTEGEIYDIEYSKWVPVSERLPDQGQEVICQCRANIIRVLKLDACGDWCQDTNRCYMSGFVIAWMPLPKPYEPKESEEKR